MNRTRKSTSSPGKNIPFDFVLELLDDPEMHTRPLFGCTAVYIGERIILALRKKDEYPADNGVWLATTPDHHDSLRLDFPNMRTIELFGQDVTGWQNLPFDSPDFEQSVSMACELILKRDRRIGKTPKPRGTRKKQSQSSSSSGSGYSGKSLAAKLGIKTGMRMLVVGEPDNYVSLVNGLPAGVRMLRRKSGRFDAIHYFVDSRARLEREFGGLKNLLDIDGMMWVSWPKKASKAPTDVTEGIVRATGLRHGLVDTKICAVDEIWSGLKFVYRLRDRNKKRGRG